MQSGRTSISGQKYVEFARPRASSFAKAGGYCAVHILAYGGLLGLSLLNIAANTYDPFIYFRF